MKNKIILICIFFVPQTITPQNKELLKDLKNPYMCAFWDHVAPKIEAEDFGPLNQKLGALYLIEESGARILIKKGLFKEAIHCLNDTWATFPGAPYGQPMKKLNDLENFFQKRLNFYKKNIKTYINI